MGNSVNQESQEQESTAAAVMAELFGAIGFEIGNDRSYNLLVEQVEANAERSEVRRGDAAIHGRCWKLGDGLEVWSILYERGPDMYYADCRPAFRSRYVRTIVPWELIEYEEDGEAIVCGSLGGAHEVVFELQNLTELGDQIFRRPHLQVALAGIAYAARVRPRTESTRPEERRFELASRLEGFADKACENDYVVSGRVLAWRNIRNAETAADLVWIYVDAVNIRLEILANRRSLRGQLAIGADISANIWLQGHVLEEGEITARYEGVDRQFEMADFWSSLRMDN